MSSKNHPLRSRWTEIHPGRSCKKRVKTHLERMDSKNLCGFTSIPEVGVTGESGAGVVDC